MEGCRGSRRTSKVRCQYRVASTSLVTQRDGTAKNSSDLHTKVTRQNTHLASKSRMKTIALGKCRQSTSPDPWPPPPSLRKRIQQGQSGQVQSCDSLCHYLVIQGQIAAHVKERERKGAMRHALAKMKRCIQRHRNKAPSSRGKTHY